MMKEWCDWDNGCKCYLWDKVVMKQVNSIHKMCIFYIGWLVGFYGISTSYGLFYAKSCLCTYIKYIWIVSVYFVVQYF